MGYTLTIGELGNDGAEEITLAQAPTFTGDKLTGRSNRCTADSGYGESDLYQNLDL